MSSIKYFKFGKWSITLEWAWGLRATWKVQIDDEDLTFGTSFIFGCLWLSIAHNKWLRWPHDPREIGLFIHDWTIHWKTWANPHSWSSTTPKWKDGWFNIADFVLGKEIYSSDPITTEEVTIPIAERNYHATAKLENCTWKRSRWPWPKHLRRVDITMHDGNEIPVPGKGENEWDCGEDATYSMITTADSISEGINNLISDVLKTRNKYGGKDWKPADRCV